MARHSKSKREAARRFYLTGEVPSVAEIARRLRIKAHTVGQWKKDEDWDALRLKIDRQAAEKLVAELATERVTLNAHHFKMWNFVVTQLLGQAKPGDGVTGESIRRLERMAAVLEKVQKGQRLARGLSLDGQTEEQIRAQAAADTRALVDVFIDVVKVEVGDEDTRDRIARALFECCPTEYEAEDAVA